MIKMRLIKALNLLGFCRLFRFLNRNKLLIVLYHGVAPEISQGLYNYRGKFIPPEVFAKQVKYLKNNYHVMNLDEAITELKSDTLPPYSLVITFDDGYKNFYDYAFPILKNEELTATFFIPTDFVFKNKPLWIDRLECALSQENNAEAKRKDMGLREALKKMPDEEKEIALKQIERGHDSDFKDFNEEREVYAPLDVAMMKEMMSEGMTFGAHSVSHPIMTRVKPDAINAEINGSKDTLQEALGKISNIFCYPNGQKDDFNENTETAIKNSGFIGALTTLEGLNGKEADVYKLQRVVMDNINTKEMFEAAISGLRGMTRKLL